MNKLPIAIFVASILLAAPLAAQTTDAPSGPEVPVTQPAGDPDVSATPSPNPVERPAMPARPANPDELRERIVFLLSGYEFFPTRDDLDQAGEPAAVAAILIDLVRDKDARGMHRLRAVDALGFYELPRAAGFLRSLTRGAAAADLEASARHSALMQHHAITALARSQRGESVAALEPFLVGDDLQLKLTAVVALGKHGKDPGRERLRALLASDDNQHVQREARKFVR